MPQCSIESREIICRQTRCRKPLDFNLLRISHEFLIDQNNFFTISFINSCAVFNDIVFNRSEARSQKNRQLSSCTCTKISNKTRFIGPLMKFR